MFLNCMEYLDRLEIFQRPTTQKEIFGNKKSIIIIDGLEGAVTKIENLGKDEGALIKCDIIPGGFEGNYYSWQNFLKMGPLVHLKAPRTIEESIQERAGPVNLRIDAFNSLKEEKLENRIRAGYYWDSLRLGRVKGMVTLDDCMKGAWLFSFCY